jgi:5-dehydro-2-deoxygluconokinase
MSSKTYDLICMGRSSIDLYSNDSGSQFKDITSFASFVGGCPTNIAVGTRRLGLKTVLLTAVGEDPVGDFVLNFLDKEKVETKFIPLKSGFRTSAVLLGIEPPDKFPLVFYRENCADFQLTIDDVDNTPIAEAQALLVSGTGLSREPSRSATIYAIEKAKSSGAVVFLDLDFRADQWINGPAADIRAYGVTVRSLLHLVDFVIGTQEEIKAAMLKDKSHVTVRDSQVSAPEVLGDEKVCIAELLRYGPKAIIEKRGADGAAVHLTDGKSETAEPFKVDICNLLGAGDAFASGFIYGYLKGWDWKKCIRMGNATGAIVVTKQGCANFMPTETEALDFIKLHGGFAAESLGIRR